MVECQSFSAACVLSVDFGVCRMDAPLNMHAVFKGCCVHGFLLYSAPWNCPLVWLNGMAIDGIPPLVNMIVPLCTFALSSLSC